MMPTNDWNSAESTSFQHDVDIRPAPQPAELRKRTFPDTLSHLFHVTLFAFKRSLPVFGLVLAMVFITTSYIRVDRQDASLSFAYFKAEMTLRMGQDASPIPITDKRGHTYRLPARDIVNHFELADLSKRTRSSLILNAKIAIVLGLLAGAISILRTIRRIF